MYWSTKDFLNIEVLFSHSNKIEVEAVSNESYIVKNIKPIFYNLLEKMGLSKNKNKKPPILFIHGSFHSAWCFAENFMPFFNGLGHDCYAISLRGTESTGVSIDDANKSIKNVKIEDHVEDVSFCINYITELYSNQGLMPIVVAHSFGGFILMKILEINSVREKINSVALLCSVPPSGNGPMTIRFLKKNVCSAVKIVLGFVLKLVTKNEKLCREIFFDEQSFTSDEVQRFFFFFIIIF
jgi:pimeloyl-ACP methyl ester carboxylesterase